MLLLGRNTAICPYYTSLNITAHPSLPCSPWKEGAGWLSGWLWALPWGALRTCFLACCRQEGFTSTTPQNLQLPSSLWFSRLSPSPAATDSGRVIISAWSLLLVPPGSAQMLSDSRHPGMRSTRLFALTFDLIRPPSEPEGWARERRTIFGLSLC